MSNIGALIIDLIARTGTFETDLGRAAKTTEKRAKQINKELSQIGKAVVGFFAVKNLKEFGERILDNADNLNKLSQSSGVSVERLSALQFAAAQSGVDIAGLANGLKKLNVAISEAAGNSKSDAATAFKAMGIAIKDAAGNTKSADEVLGEIAGKFAGYEDGANKTALAVKLFGKAGADLIPLLNSGAEGLKALTEQARKAGLVISGETAKAAEEFNDKLSLLKATLTTGIGNKIAEQLLPTLNALADQFLNSADGIDTMDHVSRIAATGLKLLLDAGLSVGHVFDELGEQIGAAGAAIVAVLHRDFAQAAEIVKARNEDAIKADENLQDRLAAIWRDGGDSVLEEIKITAKKVKVEAPNIAGAAEIGKATEAAIKKLKEFKQGILEQAATFGLGEAASIKYRLEFGNLADEIKAAGEAGKQLKGGILAAANFRQAQEDTKLLGDALAEVNAQISELSGDTVAAAMTRFRKGNEELRKTIARNGNQHDTEQLNSLRDLVEAQAKYNALQTEAKRIQDDLAIQEQRISNSQQTGAITDLDALEALDEARSKAVVQLDAIYERQKAIADQSNNPALVEGAKQFGAQIEDLAAQTDLLKQRFKATFEDAAAGPFADFITGAISAGDAVKQFTASFEREIAQLIAKNLIQKLFSADSSQATGSGGGFFSAIASLFSGTSGLSGLFGGGRANGGRVTAGMMYRVNEREEEYFKPDGGGTVIPLSRMPAARGGNVTQNINVQGRVDMRTASQLARESARQQRQASARFG